MPDGIIQRRSKPVLDSAHSGCLRRFVEGTAAMALWMALGFAFHLSADAYLLLGIPIATCFQHAPIDAVRNAVI
jgi:hypothetical protein